ncbi:hypothetical protein FOCC_FOCC003281 [Frankliniella occidentalis]|nr:hypothetical protein FOCC_FOCC003281 [Frankliniella occidentalis]
MIASSWSTAGLASAASARPAPACATQPSRSRHDELCLAGAAGTILGKQDLKNFGQQLKTNMFQHVSNVAMV